LRRRLGRDRAVPRRPARSRRRRIARGLCPEEQRLRLDRLSLALGGPTRVILEGEVGGITRGLLAGGLREPASLPAQLRIALFGAPVAAFDRLWPLGFSPGGRRWVLANVHDGMLDEAA